MLEKKVRIVSLDKRYRKEAYPSVPVFSSRLGTYLTGQHIDPTDPTTKGNFTVKQMLGEESVTKEQTTKFPYMIIPEVRVPIEHLRTFDLSLHEDGTPKYPKDFAEFTFICLQEFVAKTKNAYKPGTHYFYIEDLQAEAETRVSARELRFRAEKLIRENANIGRYRDLAILLNYKIPTAKIMIDNLSDVLIQDKLFDACESNPVDVISCFDETAHEDLFILKAAHHGIITRKGISFYDGDQFLGDTVEEVKKFIRREEGARFKIRWGSHIAKIENKEYKEVKTTAKADRFEDIKSELARAILNEDFSLAERLYEQGLMINANDAELQRLKSKMPNGQSSSQGNDTGAPATTTNTDNSNQKKQYSEMEDKGLVLLLSKHKVEKSKWENATREERIALLQEISPR